MTRIRVLVNLLALVAALLVIAPASAATTLFVDDDLGLCDDTDGTPFYCTIQAAVDDASDGDTISIAAGTYTGASTAVVVVDAIDLTITGAGQGVTIVSGEDTRRGFQVHNGSTTTISNLTVTDGSIADSGGGISLGSASTLDLVDVTVQGNTSTFNGGGIYVTSLGNLDLLRVSFIDNTADNGGGVYLGNDVTATITDSVFSLNDATNTSGGGIAGISSGDLTITRTRFDSNTAIGTGGGVYVSATEFTVTITDSHFTGNTAVDGGGMFSMSGLINVENSLFDHNTASTAGGGLYHDSLEASGELLRVVNTTFYDNEATTGDGGGAFADGFFVNTTFNANTAGGHGGGLAGNVFGTVNAANSIFAGNTAVGTGPDCHGVWSEGHNLVQSDPGYPNGPCIAAASDLTGNVIGVDPGLSPLAANGGGTWTMAISSGSPARDAANPDPWDPADWDDYLDEAVGDWSCASVDQRGHARSDGSCDIGAFEVATVIRYAGANRYATAAAVSAGDFPDAAPHVFVATGLNFPDALAGAAAAGRFECPLLLVDGGIPAATATELDRHEPSLITILGGTGAVSATVETALAPYTDTVERVSSTNRYLTAVEISQAAFSADGSADIVYVATGLGFADALAAAAAATEGNGPVLLVSGTTLLQAVADEIVRLTPDRIVVVGGTAAVSDAVLTALDALQGDDTVDRISGSNRYATAAAISADAFPNGAGRVYIATGLNFPDALAGAAAAGTYDSPVLLVPGTSLPTEVANEITRLQATTIVILGGTAVVSTAVESALAALIGAS